MKHICSFNSRGYKVRFVEQDAIVLYPRNHIHIVHYSLNKKTLTQFRGESAMRHTVPPGFALYPSTSSGCSEHLLEAINGAARFSYLLSA